jgi:hypothetical protein
MWKKHYQIKNIKLILLNNNVFVFCFNILRPKNKNGVTLNLKKINSKAHDLSMRSLWCCKTDYINRIYLAHIALDLVKW